eukprot:scaffold1536_cov397-Prasinococcus_capsulatus_cf.AAC.10
MGTTRRDTKREPFPAGDTRPARERGDSALRTRHLRARRGPGAFGNPACHPYRGHFHGARLALAGRVASPEGSRRARMGAKRGPPSYFSPFLVARSVVRGGVPLAPDRRPPRAAASRSAAV